MGVKGMGDWGWEGLSGVNCCWEKINVCEFYGFNRNTQIDTFNNHEERLAVDFIVLDVTPLIFMIL